MPGAALSFANNFWGKEDKGVQVIDERLKNSKQTCDDLRLWYKERSLIEDDYAKKLSKLSKMPLAQKESGSLQASLSVFKSEAGATAAAHQSLANQFKADLEEPLNVFSTGMRERRKQIQTMIDKTRRVKLAQQQQVQKLKEKYEADSQRVTGYIAQQNMVIGKELEKNNVKLEKVQVSQQGSNRDYQTAIKVLQETTERWNREWKAACDKFQDIEEERIDFLKSNLWTFANLSSTVCVSDDEACERIRVSLEQCEVEKDIAQFIHEKGTGQEIPDAPKYMSYSNKQTFIDDAGFTVAQFSRDSNPQFKSSSSVNLKAAEESSADIDADDNNPLRPVINDYPLDGITQYCRTESVISSTISRSDSQRTNESSVYGNRESALSHRDESPQRKLLQKHSVNFPTKMNNERPLSLSKSMPRIDISPERRPLKPDISRESTKSAQSVQQMENFSDYESDIQAPVVMSIEDYSTKKNTPIQSGSIYSGDAANRRMPQISSPDREQPARNFRQQDYPEKAYMTDDPLGDEVHNETPIRVHQSPTHRTPYGSPSKHTTPVKQVAMAENAFDNDLDDDYDPRAKTMLSVGGNVFEINASQQNEPSTNDILENADDPIAAALAELKLGSSSGTNKLRRKNFFGNRSVSPLVQKETIKANNDINQVSPNKSKPKKKGFFSRSVSRSNVSDQITNDAEAADAEQVRVASDTKASPVKNTTPQKHQVEGLRNSTLGAPPQAHTKTEMLQASNYYTSKTAQMFAPNQDEQSAYMNRQGNSRGSGRKPVNYGYQDDGVQSYRPYTSQEGNYGYSEPPNRPSSRNSQARSITPQPYVDDDDRLLYRSPSQNSFARTDFSPRRDHNNSENSAHFNRRAVSPAPSFRGQSNMNAEGSYQPRNQHHGRPKSIADFSDRNNGQLYRENSRGTPQYGDRPPMQYRNSVSSNPRGRSRSFVETDRRQFTEDGRRILGQVYDYQAAIPEELSFRRNDILLIYNRQEDGWWEGQNADQRGHIGLFPSNFTVYTILLFIN